MNRAHEASGGHLVAVVALLAAMTSPGCSSPGDVHNDGPVVSPRGKATRTRNGAPTQAQMELRRGIRSYEEAEYEIAVRKIQSALDRGLKAPGDKSKAYKYLAFVACASGRMKSCHAQFRNALRADPGFDLAPAEAGHPVWGPVFRNARLEVSGKARSR